MVPPKSPRDRTGPGLSKARRSAAVRSLGGEALSREAEEGLFAFADIMTEARVDEAGYCGSTMITVRLDAVASGLRNLDTDAERAAFLVLASGSVRVRLRAMRFACAEAARRVPERSLGTFSVDTRMRLEGARLLIDVDVEAPFAEVEREQHG